MEKERSKHRGITSLSNRIAVLLLCMIVFLLSGCDAFQQPGSDSQQDAEKDLLKTVDVCISQGQRFQNLLMDETAAYFYGFAGSAVGSMRLAVERILWLIMNITEFRCRSG